MKYIYHISDIHIKLENSENLRNSYDILIRDIVKRGVSECLLIIVGDIFENKTYLTTDELFIFFRMLRIAVSNNVNILIIPGNHDYNINSKYVNNNISLLVKRLPKIKCVSESCVETIDNIDFYIFSPIDKKIPSLVPNNRIKIALLHEPVINAKYDNGSIITEGRFSCDALQRFDFVMLGDIHKPQFLKPNIAYCGSFVQKNKGEGLDHGYILWDLEARVGRHVFIPLKEVYIKIEACDDACKLPTLSDGQKVKYISLYYRDCSNTYLEELKCKIKNRYGYINRVIDKTPYNMIASDIDQKYDEKINGCIDQETLIKEILKGEDLSLVNKIIDFHNERMQNKKDINYTSYTINYMTWSNIFCYGENNYIDFRTFKQDIVLLNGKNKFGKSSVVDILIIALFNECTRGYKDDIVNKRKKRGHIKLSFNIGADEYIIEQYLMRTRDHKYHRLFKNGQNITKQSINDTYKFIRNDIGLGNVHDFLNLVTALQNRQFIIDMDKRDLLTFLSRIFNIESFQLIEKEVISEINTIKRIHKNNREEHDILEKELSKLDKPKLDESAKKYKDILDKIEKCSLKTIAKIQYLRSIYDANKSKSVDFLDEVDFQALEERIKDFAPLDTDSIRQDCMQLTIRKNILKRQITPYSIDIVGSVPTEVEYNIYTAEFENLCEIATRPTGECSISTDSDLYKKTETDIEQFLQNSPDVASLYKKLINPNNEVLLEPEMPEYITFYESYISYIASFPDFAALERDINEAEDIIQLFDKNYSCMSFADDCMKCQENKDTIDHKYNITSLYRTLQMKKNVLNDKQEMEATHKLYSDRIKEINLYNDLSADYPIWQEIRQIRLHKEVLTHKRWVRRQQLAQLIKNYKGNTRRLFCREIGEIDKKMQEYDEYLSKVAEFDKYKQYNETREACVANKKMMSDIENLTHKLKDIDTKRMEYMNLYIKSERDLSIYETKLESKNKLENIFHTHETQLTVLQMYLKCINHKTGIPTLMMSKLCKLIEYKCNLILENIADFEIELKYDKEFKIYTRENGIMIPANMSSGYQKFILDMILRITLINISTLSNPGIIFIDEGFGSLDKENFISMANTLNTFKQYFSAVIIITHIDELKSYSTRLIDVQKINGYSKIEYGDIKSTELNLNIIDELTDDGDRANNFINREKSINSLDLSELQHKLITLEENMYHCKACNKKLKLRDGAIEKHLTAKSLLSKHTNFAKKYNPSSV